MTDNSPVFLIIATDHTANTETIQFYARSVYEAKKALTKATLFETQRLSMASGSKKDPQAIPEFFGVNPEPKLACGDTFVFAIQGEAGNNSHSIKIEQITCTETGYVRSVPLSERALLQTFRLQTVGLYDAAKLKFDVPEEKKEEEVEEKKEEEVEEEKEAEVPKDNDAEKKTRTEERTENSAFGTPKPSQAEGNDTATHEEEETTQTSANLKEMDSLLEGLVDGLRQRRRGRPKKKRRGPSLPPTPLNNDPCFPEFSVIRPLFSR